MTTEFAYHASLPKRSVETQKTDLGQLVEVLTVQFSWYDPVTSRRACHSRVTRTIYGDPSQYPSVVNVDRYTINNNSLTVEQFYSEISRIKE